MSVNSYQFYGTREVHGNSTLVSESMATVKTVITFDHADRSDAKPQIIELDDDDVVEVDLGSVTLIMSVAELNQYARKGELRGDGTDMLPTTLAPETATRGVVSVAIQALRVLGINVAAGAVKLAAKKVESWLDDGGPGLYIVAEDGTLTKAVLPSGDQPALLLIHGTGSSTARGFADILPSSDANETPPPDRQKRWDDVYAHFDGRVYALEHKTLTDTPLTNVMQFLDALPEHGGPPLVLLTHSRGGVVGDYLSCLAEWESQPPELLDVLEAKSSERTALDALTSRLRQIPRNRRPRVERHIRVATPAAGTSLAHKKTHIWLSMLAGLSGRLPGVGSAFSALGDLAAAIVKEGLEPDVLPGIDAQKNSNVLIRSAQFYHSVNTELFAVTGTSHGALSKTLSVVFPGRHDLVVDTHSMLRGPEYRQRFELAVDDDEITHTSYFRHRRIEAHLNSALIGKQSSAFKAVSRPTDTRGHISAANPDEDTGVPCLILLPGIMGSELSEVGKGDECDIWLDVFQLFIGRGKKLQISNDAIKPTGVLERGYDDFVAHVRSGRRAQVIPFGYDWRKSVFDSVAQLEKLVQRRLSAAPGKPIVFVCHSMGGLVARAWRIKHAATWEQIKNGGGRLMQLGTPNYGSWTIPTIFRREESLLRKLALADIKNKQSDWLKWISEYQGLLELSDFDQAAADLKDVRVWKTLAQASIKADLLRKAVAARETLANDNFEQDDAIIYVAGHQDYTPALDDTDKNNLQIIKKANAGDGRVLWPAEGQKSVDYYLPAVHGDLLNAPEYFNAVLELALTGSTRLLQTHRPADKATRSAAPIEADADSADAFDELLQPTVHSLEAAALGGTESESFTHSADTELLTLSVAHGNLLFCDAPVMAGHYIGDGIQHAERTLDIALNGALSHRWILGSEFYPGKIPSNYIALKQDRETPGPQGAIIVGLGHIGELQKGDLIETIRHGVLEYTQFREQRGDDCTALKIASLLIGSYEALELQDVIDAIITGVQLANSILKSARSGSSPPVRISAVEFIEWHLDVALEARHLLDKLPKKKGLELTVVPGVRNIAGGHTRAYVSNHSDWWESLSIRMQKPQRRKRRKDKLTTLTFSVLGGSAMGTSASVKYNAQEIDASLLPLVSTSNKPKAIAVAALFEQLVPSLLKPFAAQRRNLILNLDPASAALPWEVLVDRSSSDDDPVAVGAGMLRRIVPDPEDMPPGHAVYAEGNTALVIGNPPGGPRFGDLPGAAVEAQAVSKLFNAKKWLVNDDNIFAEVPANTLTAAAIRQDIIASDYRVLHFAAHGLHEEHQVDRSGVVIGFDERTQTVELFSPHHVHAIRNKPSLVFINCCHTGKVKNWQANKLSASLAAEFMKSGVHCVIGAGWAVEDNAAKLFAETVYQVLLDGRNFGHAIRRARLSVYRAFGNTNTWSAFQCYGDPGYVLEKHGHAGTAEYAPAFQHLDELLHALKNLRADVKGAKASELQKADIVSRAVALYKAAKDHDTDEPWKDRGDVLTQLALVYCDVEEDDKADEFLTRAFTADRSAVSLEDTLLLLNYRARRAEARFSAKPKTRSAGSTKPSRAQTKHLKELERVADILNQYTELHNDANTLEIAASANKLLAMCHATKRPRTAAIKNMTELYDRAAMCHRSNAYYPATNALIGYALLKQASKKASDAYQNEADRLKGVIAQSLSMKKGADFWDLMSGIDVDVANALFNEEFDENFAKAIALRINKAAELHSSASELNSVCKQFRFIKICSTDKSVRKAAAIILAELGEEEEE